MKAKIKLLFVILSSLLVATYFLLSKNETYEKNKLTNNSHSVSDENTNDTLPTKPNFIDVKPVQKVIKNQKQLEAKIQVKTPPSQSLANNIELGFHKKDGGHIFLSEKQQKAREEFQKLTDTDYASYSIETLTTLSESNDAAAKAALATKLFGNSSKEEEAFLLALEAAIAGEALGAITAANICRKPNPNVGYAILNYFQQNNEADFLIDMGLPRYLKISLVEPKEKAINESKHYLEMLNKKDLMGIQQAVFSHKSDLD